jgi:hypothetical protein
MAYPGCADDVLRAAYYVPIYGFAALETANVSSNIWNRVILPLETQKV